MLSKIHVPKNYKRDKKTTSSNIQYGGSLVRSMNVGNTQNASFYSQMNLQLTGFIVDSVAVSASISDNAPLIQPDGITKQINEFDKVSLQFKKNNWQLDIGDVDMHAQ